MDNYFSRWPVFDFEHEHSSISIEKLTIESLIIYEEKLGRKCEI
jgi:hypothetical protein